MTWRIRLLLGWGLACAVVGCTPVQNPGSGGSSGDTTVDLDMGSNGVFEVGSNGLASSERVFDISSDLPSETPTRASIVLDPADISVGTSTDIGTSGVVQVTLRLSADLTTNACESGEPQTPVRVELLDDRVDIVTPSEIDVNTDGLSVLLGGTLKWCTSVAATEPRRVQIDRFRVIFPAPTPVTANSCAEILALPEVQNALTQLNASSIKFDLPGGSTPPSIVDGYALTEEITFDPDASDVGKSKSGSVTIGNQTATTVERSGFDSSITQFIVGDASSIGLCALSRTNDPLCDQTIARLESLRVDEQTGNLSGQFLSVAVRRHANRSPSCGATGDFIFGSLDLMSQSGQLARRRGKVLVAETMTPDLLLLAPSAGTGVFSDVGSGVVTQFDTTTPFESRPITAAAGLTPLGTSALGYSDSGAVLAVVTDRPDASVSYDGSTLNVIRQTQSTAADYIGEVVDFDPAESRIYVPTTSPDFVDRVTILRADDSVFPDEVRRMPTPDGAVPVYARVSPDGALLATLLEGEAPIGQADQLVFANIDRNIPNFILPVIDLVADAGGTALAQQLVFSRDGSQIFLAGLGAVVVVETGAPFDITRIDVSGGVADNPVALALSGDGEVLAVAVDDQVGGVNFAVMDVATLQVVHTARLPGISDRGAVDIAHFETGRVAMVANIRSEVVAVQTQDPFDASRPLSVADVADLNSIGRMSSSGSVIAVSNIDEPAIYLFELPTP